MKQTAYDIVVWRDTYCLGRSCFNTPVCYSIYPTKTRPLGSHTVLQSIPYSGHCEVRSTYEEYAYYVLVWHPTMNKND